MKLKKLKIDGILVFYVLSLGLIGLSWKYGLIQLRESSSLSLPQQFEIEDKLYLERDAEGSIEKLYVHNPSLVIHYSEDGGDSFKEAGEELVFAEIENPAINQTPASLRWMPDYSGVEQTKSVVVFLENTQKSIRSNLKTYTSVAAASTTLPIVHLNVSHSAFFDHANGMLVPGKHAWRPEQYREEWWAREANYTQRGSDWEKEACFQIFEAKALKFESKSGIRISGNGTRSLPQKSFRIKARRQYETDKFETGKLFGEDGLKKYESLVLRMSGNDNNRTMFADLLMQRLASKSNLLTQKGMPVCLYINGNYWGVYNLRERIDDYFVAKYADGKKKDVTILEDAYGTLKDGSEEVQEIFLALIEDIKTKDELTDDDVSAIAREVDLESYMDYIFFETYYANNDWPENNAICYKVKDEKWKWLLNDLDYSLAYPGTDNVDVNMFDRIKNSESVHAVLFNKLLTNQAFKMNFSERASSNLAEFLSVEQIQKEYASLKELYQPEMPNQIKRWRMIDSTEEWEENCENNLKFLESRRLNYAEHLIELMER